MAHSRSTGESPLWTTGRRPGLAGVAVVVVLLAALILIPRGPEQEPPEAAPDGFVSAAPSPDLRVSPDAFCTSFRALAEAHNQHVAAATAASANRVLDQATAVVDLGVPVGLTDAGYAAFAELVVGILSAIEDAETLRARVLSVARPAAPDTAAFDRYLGDVCPP